MELPGPCSHMHTHHTSADGSVGFFCNTPLGSMTDSCARFSAASSATLRLPPSCGESPELSPPTMLLCVLRMVLSGGSSSATGQFQQLLRCKLVSLAAGVVPLNARPGAAVRQQVPETVAAIPGEGDPARSQLLLSWAKAPLIATRAPMAQGVVTLGLATMRSSFPNL
jgi:hypothetical protein